MVDMVDMFWSDKEAEKIVKKQRNDNDVMIVLILSYAVVLIAGIICTVIS